MSCNSRKSKTNPYSKEKLIELAIEKGMSKSKAQKSTKDELCEYLEIDKKIQPKISSSKKLSPSRLSINKKRPCGVRRSNKNPDAYQKDELIELLVSNGLITRSYGAKHKLSELCDFLSLIKSPKKSSPDKNPDKKGNVKFSYGKVKSSKTYKPRSFEPNIENSSQYIFVDVDDLLNIDIVLPCASNM